MTTYRLVDRYLIAKPAVSVLLYGLTVLVLAAVAAQSCLAIIERRAAFDAAVDLLARMEGRATAGPSGKETGAVAAGSHFLEGQTVTVAGAALLQRVTSAVVQVGGTILSSQVDLRGTPGAADSVASTVSCEVEEKALQPLLYDLEAGWPFLFIDHLVAHAPPPGTSADGGRMRVLLSVSGQWVGGR